MSKHRYSDKGRSPSKKRRPSKRRWIQAALKGKHKGALHCQLGVPLGKKIPVALLRKAAKAPGKLGQRARFALWMRMIRLRHERRGRT